MRALLSALFGAAAGVMLCALGGAILMQAEAMRSPSADLRPATAWLFGALWFGIGFGPAAGAVGGVVGLLVGLLLGKSRSSGGEG